MNSKDIKAALRAKLGFAVNVHTIPGKGRKWIDARVRPSGRDGDGDSTYPSAFPEDFRRKALAVVYGAEFALKQSVGGNIHTHSISLYADQWETVFDPEAVFPLDFPVKTV